MTLARKPGAWASRVESAASRARSRAASASPAGAYGTYCTIADSTCRPGGASEGSFTVGIVTSIAGAAEHSPYFEWFQARSR